MNRRTMALLIGATGLVATLTAVAVITVNRTGVSAVPADDAYAGDSVLVGERSVEAVHSIDAAIEAVAQATLSAQTAGTVTQLNVDAGDRVRRGQLLVRIDTREVDAQLAANRANVAQAEARVVQARQNLQRTQSLVKNGFVSQAVLDSAAADHDAAQAALRAAQAGSSQASAARSFAELRSPMDGIVTRRRVELGELATPGRALLEIHDPSRLRAVGTIPQYLLAKLSSTSAARVELADGRRLPVERLAILPSADPRLLATEVRAELPTTAPADLVPGSSVKILIPFGSERRLALPARAVIERGELVAVHVVSADGRLQLRQVRLGRPLEEDQVEVLAGLSVGERVALPAAPRVGQSEARYGQR
jgi:membrane fusion protein, multidrug efflux system